MGNVNEGASVEFVGPHGGNSPGAGTSFFLLEKFWLKKVKIFKKHRPYLQTMIRLYITYMNKPNRHMGAIGPTRVSGLSFPAYSSGKISGFDMLSCEVQNETKVNCQ